MALGILWYILGKYLTQLSATDGLQFSIYIYTYSGGAWAFNSKNWYRNHPSTAPALHCTLSS